MANTKLTAIVVEKLAPFGIADGKCMMSKSGLTCIRVSRPKAVYPRVSRPEPSTLVKDSSV